jgi:hypothetical protein
LTLAGAARVEDRLHVGVCQRAREELHFVDEPPEEWAPRAAAPRPSDFRIAVVVDDWVAERQRAL